MYFLQNKTENNKLAFYNVPFIMINAWNEWAEGAYLEPDTMNGYKYLQAIEKVTKKWL